MDGLSLGQWVERALSFVFFLSLNVNGGCALEPLANGLGHLPYVERCIISYVFISFIFSSNYGSFNARRIEKKAKRLKKYSTRKLGEFSRLKEVRVLLFRLYKVGISFPLHTTLLHSFSLKEREIGTCIAMDFRSNFYFIFVNMCV